MKVFRTAEVYQDVSRRRHYEEIDTLQYPTQLNHRLASGECRQISGLTSVQNPSDVKNVRRI